MNLRPDEEQTNEIVEQVKIDIYMVQTRGQKGWTQISNIDKFISLEQIEELIKKFKKKVGCMGTWNKKENRMEFSGNHKHVIERILKEDYKIPEELIVVHG